MTEASRTRCRSGFVIPDTRIDAMYRGLRLWQQLVLWFVSITATIEVPEVVAPEQPLRGVLTLSLMFGLFVGQILLFTWYNRRW